MFFHIRKHILSFKDLPTVKDLKVLSFGCGPCTDLFAIDYLHTQGVLPYETLDATFSLKYCANISINSCIF